MYKTVTEFLNFLINQISLLILLKNFFWCILKMSKDSSGKYYQDNKERQQQKNFFKISNFF